MPLDMESLYISAKKLLYYITHIYGFNNFLIDEVDDELVRQLRDAIVSEDRTKTVRLYLKLEKQLDDIREKHCFDNPELPYKSNFRTIAKEMYRELKSSHLLNHDDTRHVAYILRFISTSSYDEMKRMLRKRSLSWYMYCNIPINPYDFYCTFIPLECIMDYCLKIVKIYMTWENEYED